VGINSLPLTVWEEENS